MRRRLLLSVLALACVTPSAAATASAALPPVPRSQALAELYADHAVYASPDRTSTRIAILAEIRPITGQRTAVPVIGRRTESGSWLHVRVPGRPNGRSGWISARSTEETATPWAVVVQIAKRRVLVYRDGRRVRTFSAIVGKAATPTPHGRFFVEEIVRMAPGAGGAPWALATSARSNVLQRFEGGVGQIALHGTHNLTGRMGTGASHGCVRVGDAAIDFLASHMEPGVPITLRSR